MRGVFTGMLLGAAAMAAYGMMDERAHRRVKRCAAVACRRAARFAGDLFDR